MISYFIVLWSLWVVTYLSLAAKYQSPRPLKARKQRSLAAVKAEFLAAQNKIGEGTTKIPGTDLVISTYGPAPVYETFDHPAPPLMVLKASMPSPPLGYRWEVSTPAVDGDPVLRVTLLQLSDLSEVETIEGNLIVARRWKYANDETYAQLYRRAEKISAKKVVGYEHLIGSAREVYNTDHQEILGRVMMGNLITPIVDWASILVLRYIAENPDESKVNYMLIGAKEEVAA